MKTILSALFLIAATAVAAHADKITVEMSPYDLSKGRIICRGERRQPGTDNRNTRKRR